MTSRTGRRFFFSSFLGKLFLLTLSAVPLAQHIAQGPPSPPAKKILLVYAYNGNFSCWGISPKGIPFWIKENHDANLPRETWHC